MRYFLNETTLFIRGSFRAAGTPVPVGVVAVSTILDHAIPDYAISIDAGSPPAGKELELAAAAEGIRRDYTGFITAGPITNLVVLQYDFLTVFITAGISREKSRKSGAGTLGIIVCSSQGMSDTALQEAVDTTSTIAAEAFPKEAGKEKTGSPGSVIVACEGEEEHSEAGPKSPVGSRIRSALLFGIPLAIQRSREPARERPAFFIFSRFKGEHWVEWTPENCPYYPCHFEGQRCDFCYCPFYPCGDESLGQWQKSSNGARVWNCAGCTMIHEPEVTDYLKKHPDAPLKELIRRSKRGKQAP